MDDIIKADPADFIVKAKVKTLIKDAGMNTSAEIWAELGNTVADAVERAINRAKANGRKTVKASDI